MKVTSDFSGIRDRLEKSKRLSRIALTEQVVKDSNYYIPKDTGNLEGSSLANSDYEAGQAVWATPYARRLYYNPEYNFSTDVNPNASGLWFERAKDERINEWERIVGSKHQ